MQTHKNAIDSYKYLFQYKVKKLTISVVFILIFTQYLAIYNDEILVECVAYSPYSNDKAKTYVSKDGSTDNLPYNLEETFFEVTNPPEITFTFRIRMAKNYGSVFKTTLKNIPLIPVDPFNACSSIRNVNELKGKIAFAQRGDCSFLSKTINAENVGAIAIIITDNDPTNEFAVDMVDDETGRVTGIPSAFLTWKDGYMIKKTLEKSKLKQAIINIPLNLTLKDEHVALRKAPWSYY